MSEVNQLAISKILGSVIRPVGPVRFGGFGVLQSTLEMLKAMETQVDEEDPPHFSIEQDRLVAHAFEEVRYGSATDELLWNKSLASPFVLACRKRNLLAPQGFLIRRLINIRKNPKRFENRGIVIAPATKLERHPSIVQKYAHIIEFALVRLRYRHGASIEQILASPILGEQFEKLAHEVAPDLSDEELRLGALYIRKSRYIKKRDLDSVRRLDANQVEQGFLGGETLDKLVLKNIPSSPGLLELKDGNRHLYVSRNDDLKAVTAQLVTGQGLALASNGFWTPNRELIRLYFAPGAEFEGISMDKWQLKLLHDRSPLFNWPIHRMAA